MPKRVVACPFLRIRSPPVFVDLVIYLDNLAVKGDRGPSMRRGHGNYGVDRVRLVVGLDEHRSRDDATHGVADDDDRGGVGEARVATGSLRIRIEGEDISDGFV